ncbi:MAG: hypothetical protein JO054_13945 [Actinobacteria bacterium]|nr:hypothetical protein [Actinomycetota bacterium]MBV9255330.1 hypothetical protein [Actinomycetota bacterium]
MTRSFRLLTALVVGLFYASVAGLAVQHSFDVKSADSTSGQSLSTGVGGAGLSGGSAAGDGSAASGDNGAGGSTGDAGGSGSSTGGSSTAGSAATVGSTGGTGSNGTGTGGRTASTTKANLPPLVVGIHDSDAGAAFSQYGVKGGPSGDQGPWINEVVNWINANGGMGGRKLQLVTHVTQSINGTFDQQAEEACVDFTEDHHVSVVVGGALVPTMSLADCLARHKTPLVWNYDFMVDRASYARYADYLYMPSMVQLERLGAWIDTVADAGFFDKGTVGIVRYDEPLAKHLDDDVLRPRLAARGVQVKDEAAFRGATGAASAADLSAQSNSTVLRFQSEGINRVILEPTAAVMPLLFFTAAQAQNYHARYTYTSYDVPEFQSENNGASQLAGSMAYGWVPAGDIKYAQDTSPNNAVKRCVAITHDATPTGNGSIRRYCDGLLFLKFAFDHGADPSVAGMRRVIESLGTSYESAWTFTTDMSPQRHDGASVAKLVLYDTGCSCYRYSGPARPIP